MARPSCAPRRVAVVSGGLLGLAALAAAGALAAGPVRAAARAAVPPAAALLSAEGALAPPLPTDPRGYMIIVHREGLLNGLLNDLP